MIDRSRPRWMAVVAALWAAAGCAASPFPDTIDFGGRTLSKATSWTHGGIAGVVYVPPGETLPAASTQVGTILSSEHTTADALHGWIMQQAGQSGDYQGHEQGAPGESCRAAMTKEKRAYISLIVCQTGVARAACVEADETLDLQTFEACLHRIGCFADICDERIRMRREKLDLLAADMLTKR